MIDLLKSFEKQKLIETIEENLKKNKKIIFKNVSPKIIIDILHEIENVDIDEEDIELNGWQGDFWIPFRYKDFEWELSGCMYIGSAILKTEYYLEE